MKLILATLAIASFAKGAEETADLAHVITLGTRPYYLLDEMESSELKEKLGESFICRCSQFFTRDCLIYIINDIFVHLSFMQSEECARTTTNFARSDFSIGHRGACMQYPEHTIESYKASALQGAGIIECDVTFTKDRELICK